MNKKCNNCFSTSFQAYKAYDEIAYGVQIVQCDHCQHVFSLIEESIDYEQFYNQGKYVLQDNRGSFFDRVIGLNNRLITKKISATKNRGRLLDFGSGKGQFLSLFDSKFWKRVGVETSLPRAKFASANYGLDISTDTYQFGIIGPGEFDVITLFHVLEHLPDPKSLLKNLLRGNLKKGGLVVLEVPLINSWQSRIGKENWIHLDPPIHFSHFSKAIMKSLLLELNIKPIKYSYFSLPLGILGMCQAIMSRLGYKGLLIEDLKFSKTFSLLVALLLVLPLATLLESLSLLFERGGVIRVYGIYSSDKKK